MMATSERVRAALADLRLRCVVVDTSRKSWLNELSELKPAVCVVLEPRIEVDQNDSRRSSDL